VKIEIYTPAELQQSKSYTETELEEATEFDCIKRSLLMLRADVVGGGRAVRLSYMMRGIYSTRDGRPILISKMVEVQWYAGIVSPPATYTLWRAYVDTTNDRAHDWGHFWINRPNRKSNENEEQESQRVMTLMEQLARSLFQFETGDSAPSTMLIRAGASE
jgi:hypothetical protein